MAEEIAAEVAVIQLTPQQTDCLALEATEEEEEE